MFKSISGWAGLELKVLKYNASENHVLEAPEKLSEAYELGRSLSSYKRHELLFPCIVDGCKGRFSSIDALARHLASGADTSHREWRGRNGFDNLGLRTDELWMGIAKMLDNLD